MNKKYFFIALIGIFILAACGKRMSEKDYVTMWKESSNDYADFLLDSTTQSDKTNDDYLKISSSLQDKLKKDIKILKKVKHKEQINKDLQSLDEKMILSIDYYTKLTNGEETSTEEAEASYQTGNKVVSFASKYNDGKLPDSFVSLMNKFNNENTSDSSETFIESNQNSESSTEPSSSEAQVNSSENDSDITHVSEKPSSEQIDILQQLAEQEFSNQYPYKGSKLKSILGVVQPWTESNGRWFYKVEAVVVNQSNAKRDTTVEIYIDPINATSGNVEIIAY